MAFFHFNFLLLLTLFNVISMEKKNMSGVLIQILINSFSLQFTDFNRERDICVKTIIPSKTTAFSCTSALKNLPNSSRRLQTNSFTSLTMR